MSYFFSNCINIYLQFKKKIKTKIQYTIQKCFKNFRKCFITRTSDWRYCIKISLQNFLIQERYYKLKWKNVNFFPINIKFFFYNIEIKIAWNKVYLQKRCSLKFSIWISYSVLKNRLRGQKVYAVSSTERVLACRGSRNWNRIVDGYLCALRRFLPQKSLAFTYSLRYNKSDGIVILIIFRANF